MGFHENKRWARFWREHTPEFTTCREHVGANSGETTLDRVKPIWHSLSLLLPSDDTLGINEMAEEDEGIGAASSVLVRRRAEERAGEGGDPCGDPPAMRGVNAVQALEMRRRWRKQVPRTECGA